MTEIGVLGYDEILKRLEDGEIFREGTWLKENIRAAAYDLRVADDFLVVPDPDYPQGRKYRKGEKRKDPIILNPGDVAFVSSQEKICLPWDLSANIGIKFSFARKGILVLTGLLVDPGSGLLKREDDLWVPKQDERLHFVLANVGSNLFVLNPGEDKIASLQFFPVIGEPKKIYVPSGEDMQDEFFGENEKRGTGLVFFKDVSATMKKTDYLEDRIETIEKSTHQIVIFGVYLISASIIIAGLSYLLSLVSSDVLLLKLDKIVKVLPTIWPQTLCLIVIVAAIGFVIHVCYKLICKLIVRIIPRKNREQDIF